MNHADLVLLDRARVATLATVSPEGRPHVVPVVFARDGNDLVTSIDGKPKKGKMLARIENVNRDPRVSLLADHYEEDWSQLWWVRVDGAASIETEGDGFERALTALRHRYSQYRIVELTGPVIRIRIERTTSWASNPS